MDIHSLENEYNLIEMKNSWDDVFDEAKKFDDDCEFESNIALLEKNRPLNRYKNALAYDHSRVILRDCNDTDYINANLVEHKQANLKYILTQGPKSSTTEHFWQMVWQERPKGIVMLNRIIELGSRKCDPYYPCLDGDDDDDDEEGELTKRYGKFEIEFLDQQLNTDAYTIHKFSVTNTEYLNWPDFEEADDKSFLEFLFEAYRLNIFNDPNYGPPIVHCSAGLGRSGTFVLINTCVELFKLHDDRLPCRIMDVLLELRKYRKGLVQTSGQFKFAYKAIIDAIKMQRGLITNEYLHLIQEEDEDNLLNDIDSDNSSYDDDLEIKDSEHELNKLSQMFNNTNNNVVPILVESLRLDLNNLDDQTTNDTSSNTFNTTNSGNDTNRSSNSDSHEDYEKRFQRDEHLSNQNENVEELDELSDDDEILIKRTDRNISTVKVNVPREPLSLDISTDTKESVESKEEVNNLSEEEAAELKRLLSSIKRQNDSSVSENQESVVDDDEVKVKIDEVPELEENYAKVSVQVAAAKPIEVPEIVQAEQIVESEQTNEAEQNVEDNDDDDVEEVVEQEQETQPNTNELSQRPVSSLQEKQERISNLVQQMKIKQLKHESELRQSSFDKYKPFLIGGGVLLASYIALKIYRNYF